MKFLFSWDIAFLSVWMRLAIPTLIAQQTEQGKRTLSVILMMWTVRQ